MRKTLPLLLLSSLLLSWSTLSLGGFGDLLKKLEETGKQVLGTSTETALDSDTIARGLKQALEVGTQKAVDLVSQADGYWGNPSIRIPLPDKVESAGKMLRRVGLGSSVDEFELSMNRAAEKAAPQARELFMSALQAMSIEDAKNILQGPDDAATAYFRSRTEGPLSERFMPIVRESMAQVGATRSYQQLTDEVAKLPMLGNLNLNLEDYVTQRALDGLFLMLAAEEKRIREDPVARTTELLKQVFGS